MPIPEAEMKPDTHSEIPTHHAVCVPFLSRPRFPVGVIEAPLNKLTKNANVATSPVLNTAIQSTYVYAMQRVRAEQHHGEQQCA
jgi:hypothetical protein